MVEVMLHFLRIRNTFTATAIRYAEVNHVLPMV